MVLIADSRDAARRERLAGGLGRRRRRPLPLHLRLHRGVPEGPGPGRGRSARLRAWSARRVIDVIDTRHRGDRQRRRRADVRAARRTTPTRTSTSRVISKGAVGRSRLHAHGAGRLQRRARPARLARAALRRHARGRQVPQRPGAGLDARQRRAASVIHELETRVGCFFDRSARTGRSTRSRSPASRFDRTVHRGDLTGIEIMGRLRDQMFRPGRARARGRRGARPRLRRRRRAGRGDGAAGRDAGRVRARPRAGRWWSPRAAGRRCTRSPRRRVEKTGDGVAMCLARRAARCATWR